MAFQLQADVESYLYDDFNIDIFEVLSEDGRFPELFDPLDFFNLLYYEFDFFDTNHNNYLKTRNHFKEIPFTGLQKYYFFKKLLQLLNNHYFSTDGHSMYFSEVGYNSYLHIKNIYEDIKNEAFPEEAIGESATTNEITSSEEKTQIKLPYTNSQLVLIFYYFLKNSGLEVRKEIDVAPVAKFMHLITGKDFKGTTSSDFYQKLLKAPNFKKTEKETIKDLEAIKPLFQKAQLNDIVTSIDKEIEIAKSELTQPKK